MIEPRLEGMTEIVTSPKENVTTPSFSPHNSRLTPSKSQRFPPPYGLTRFSPPSHDDGAAHALQDSHMKRVRLVELPMQGLLIFRQSNGISVGVCSLELTSHAATPGTRMQGFLIALLPVHP